MIILGVDPGYDRLGLAVIEKNSQKEELKFSDCFTSSQKDSIGERLLVLAVEMEKVIADWKPNLVAIEKLYFSNNQKTALSVAEARGLISYLCAKNHLPTVEYTPAEIKVTITGCGNADKKQISRMVSQLIKITKEIKYDDEYDAIAIALTCLARYPHQKELR